MHRTAAILGALLLAATITRAGQPNVLKNPGFEQLDAAGKLPLHWKQLRGNPIAIATSNPHGGKHCVHFKDDSPKKGISLESAHLPCEPGSECTVTGWARAADRSCPGLYLQFHDDTGRRTFERHVQLPPQRVKWTQLKVSAAAPDDTEFVSVLLYSFIGSVGEFDFDDIALTVSEPPEGRSTHPVATVAEGEKKPPVEIGGRLQLFVDDHLIDRMAGVWLELHPPTPREVVMKFDKPWEGAGSIYVTVFKDTDRYRVYYRGAGGGHPELTAYAESPDGIAWTRPSLGLIEFNGSKANNIVWMEKSLSHNFAPFKDTNPAAKPDERYKALAGLPSRALASPDGIRWHKMQDKPVLTQGAFDSQNLAFYDSARGRYAAYYRAGHKGVRAIRYATSQDFIHWQEHGFIDLGDTKPEHLYTNATTPYFRAPDILLAFPNRFHPQRKVSAKWSRPGVSGSVLMASRDGVRFQRTFMEDFVRPGLDPANWTDRNMHVACGVVPTGRDEISVYWVEHYGHPTVRLRRGALRVDGFVSVHADYDRGECLTRPLLFKGKELVINYATSAAGSVRFELQDADGKPIEGFSFRECGHIYGDETERVVPWNGKTDLGALAGKPVRIRVRMKDADMYSIRFR